MRWVVALLLIAALAWLLLREEPRRIEPLTSGVGASDEASVPPLLGVDPQGAGSARAGAPTRGAGGASAADAADAASEEADDRVSLRIDTVDAHTGRVVQSTWNLGSGNISGAPFPPGMEITEEALARQHQGAQDSIARWQASFLPTGSAREDVFLADETLTRARYTVRPPGGYVLDDASGRLVGQLAAGARHAVVVVPLWPEAVLDVRVVGPDGRPARDVGILTLVAAGRRRGVKPEVRGPGELRIRGIPHLPGEPLRAVLEWGWSEDEEIEVVEEELDQDDVSAAQLVTRIPDDLSRPWQVEVRLMESRSLPYAVVETDFDLPFEESFGQSDAVRSKLAPATVRARVLGREGQPVPGARVNGVETDAHGLAVLADLAPGERVISMSALGRLRARQTAALAPGVTHDVTLREPEGARLEVLVTDGQGRPRPSAQIRILDRQVFDVVDGVQRLDMFTDAAGRRSFARVEPGRVTIVATWGSHNGSREVALVDGETKRVTIVAR